MFFIGISCTDQLTSLLDSDGFELDKNYYRVEPTLDCHQKESVQVIANILIFPYSHSVNKKSILEMELQLFFIIYFQGSHVMAHAGSYILQWVCPQSSDIAAQLMFFHEVLSSENYKGSMSNLQSGISAMSLASSCQSR